MYCLQTSCSPPIIATPKSVIAAVLHIISFKLKTYYLKMKSKSFKGTGYEQIQVTMQEV